MGEDEYKVNAYKFIPPISVGLFVVGYVIFGVLLQFPSNHEIISRLVEAELFDIAWQELQNASEKDRKKLPGVYLQYETVLAVQLGKPLEGGYLKGFEKILILYKDLRYPRNTTRMLAKIIHGLKEPQEAYKLLLQALQDPDFQGKKELMIALRDRALSLNEPGLAAEIMKSHLVKAPYTLAEFYEILSYYRFASEHDAAYLWYKEAYSNIKNIDDWDLDERVAFMSEFLSSVGKPKEAFEYLHEELDYIVASNMESLFDQYILLGTQVQEYLKIASAYEMKLSVSEVNQVEDVIEFVNLLLQGGNQKRAKQLLKENYDNLDKGYKNKLGNLYEWSGQTRDAFDIYISLLVQDEDYTVLKRLLDLNHGLFRHLELASAILSVDCINNAHDLHDQIAALFDKVGMYDESIQFYKSYLSRNPSERKIWLEIAQMYRTVHRFEEMAEALEEYVEERIEKTEVEALSLMAEAYRYTNQYYKAARIYRELQRRDKSFKFIRSLIRIAELQDQMREYYFYLKESIDHYETPSAFHYWIIANYFVRSKDDETAITYLKKGVERFSENIEIRDYLLSLLFNQNRNEEALDLLDTHPQKYTNKDIFFTFFNILMEEKRYEKIEETLAHVDMSLFNNDPDIQGYIAYYYQETGQRDKFRDYAKLLYEQYPGSVEFLKQYGFSLAEDQNYKEAWDIFDKMENPGKDILINMSLFAYELKEKKMALEYALKALDSGGSFTHMEYGYVGDLYLDLGDKDRADVFYNKAVQELLKNISLR